MTLLSAGIEIKEIDLSTTVARAATGRGATVGKFAWGEPFTILQVTDEDDIVNQLGKPDDYTYESWFNTSNFTKYANDCRVVRIVDADTARNSSPIFNAVTKTITAGGTNYEVGDTITVKNGTTTVGTGSVTAVSSGSPSGAITDFDIDVTTIISNMDDGETYGSPALSSLTYEITSASSPNGSGATISIAINRDNDVYFTNPEDAADGTITTESANSLYAATGVPTVYGKYVGAYGDDITVDVITYADFNTYQGQTITIPVLPDTGASATQAVNLSVFGENGPQTSDQYGILVRYKGEIVETHVVSTKSTDKDIYGSNIYLDDYFEADKSDYITMTSDALLSSTYTDTSDGSPGRSLTSAQITLGGGVDNQASTGDWALGWDLFDDPDTIYVNLLFAGGASGESASDATTIQKYMIDNVADVRRDCLAFISPPKSYVVGVAASTAVTNVVDWRKGKDINNNTVTPNINVNTSFAACDGSYKFQNDKYNDKKRWVGLSGDIAGLCAFTDQVANPWTSPAGPNRGIIKNCIKLAYDTKTALRDKLYEAQINPVVNNSGLGFLLWGDKTMQARPSAFSQINVRRLFNMLEKQIGDSSRFKLFENNTEFTRNSFVTEVSAYLETIKARGGVIDYFVQCDERNNPPAVIDRNEFVATIFIKPPRSINYITLNFVATASGANFEELVGVPV